eukprot:3872546-Rhodomonas_salina.1
MSGSPRQQNHNISRIMLWGFSSGNSGAPKDFEVWVTDTTSLADPDRMCYKHTGILSTTETTPLEITCGQTGRYVTLRQASPLGICEIEFYDDSRSALTEYVKAYVPSTSMDGITFSPHPP